MRTTYPKEAKMLSCFLRKAGYSKRNPLVLSKTTTIEIYVYTRKYDFESPYRVKSVWPDGKTISFIGEYGESDSEVINPETCRWIRMDNPERIYETEPTGIEHDLHWTQIPETTIWGLENLVKQVTKDLAEKPRRPFECDFYSIEKRGNKKYIHIHGYFYHNEDGWSIIDVLKYELPLKEFIKGYETNKTLFVDMYYEMVNQYQTFLKDKKEALKLTKEFFDGKPADKILHFGELSMKTPVGHYINPNH